VIPFLLQRPAPRRGRARALPLLLVAASSALPAAAPAQPAPRPAQPLSEAPVRYDADLPSAAFHQGRRRAVLEALPRGAVAVFFSAPERNRQNDVSFEYRQDSDLLYLTGSREPGSILVLAPAGIPVGRRLVREILFVPPREPSQEVWLGRRFGPERAKRELLVEEALPYDRFAEILRPVLADPTREAHHLPLPPGIEEGSALDEQIRVLSRSVSVPPDHQRLRRVLDRLRTLKTEEELRLLGRAIDITVAAHREAMRSIVPGMHEYEVEALVEYTFKRSGADSPGFPSIVGSGENSVILHYETNRRRMEAGDLVVMDLGAEYHGYTADVTRTVPVSGVFSSEQRQIYELVLAAQEAAIARVRAVAGFADPHAAAVEVLAEGLARLGLIDGPGDRGGLGRFFMHGTSHYLGLDVHDVGTGTPLEPGTVLTVEPGIYIAPSADVDRRWWNIGVRIEDDVLVTGGEPVVLSLGAPRSVDEIEALMREEGLGNRALEGPGGF
jgi:Xaa-Pro aminopeptidase